MRAFTLKSFDDKHSYDIPITRDFNQWKSRKCWAFHCNHEINLVHLSPHDNATHGYCFWCYRDMVAHSFIYGGTVRNWYYVDKHYKTKKVYLRLDDTPEKYNKWLLQKYKPINNP